VEVSNKQQQKIDLDLTRHTGTDLLLPIGQDVYGINYMVDLAKAPHLLIAGTTGSGKSVGLKTIIQALTNQNTPEQLRLIIIDPKYEFTDFTRSMPHVEGVIDEIEDAGAAIDWVVNEMEERYKAIKTGKTTNFPKIVVIIDELTDLLMIGGTYVRNMIVRLAQKSRAAGIHLIIATQNPLSEVLDSNLNANLPTRICYRVATRVNSQTVLDQTGAEKLAGNGDLLLMSPTEKGLVRLQGYYTE
jgi:S-DNA-T family DNA segregation ATPase FtsK/SpoIIIE